MALFVNDLILGIFLLVHQRGKLLSLLLTPIEETRVFLELKNLVVVERFGEFAWRVKGDREGTLDRKEGTPIENGELAVGFAHAGGGAP